MRALAHGSILLLVLGAAVPAAAQAPSPPLEPPPPESGSRDSSSEETGPAGGIDADLQAAGIGSERAGRITEALRAGRYDEAETLLVEAAEAHPGSAEVLRVLGGVFFLGGRPLNAAVALKKAEAIAPLDERSRFTLVMAYVALGHDDWARPELEALAAAAPDNPLYVYWAGRLDYDEGRFAAAAKSFERAITLDPGFARAHDNLGLCYDALGRFDEAIASFGEAIRLDREQGASSPWPPLNLGLLLTRLDRLDEAETRFRESLAADPGFAPAHYQLGLVLEKTGRPAAAVAEVEEAARLDPGSAEAQYALARLYRRAGEAEKAEDALRRFRELKDAQGRKKSQAGSGPG
jgi:tetratricopeptide (TPR) repeat protein